jgi:ribosomal protein L14
MPTNNVEIETTWTPIQYKVIAGDYITVDNTKATIEDIVYFSVKDRTSEGYKLDKVLLNNVEFSGNSFAMKDYMQNIEIKATYTPIQYNIVTDDFVTVNKSTASVTDNVTFTVKDRTAEGYKLDKVLANNVEVSGTSFEMKDYLKDVEITAVYSKIDYPIITDNSVTINKTTANIGDDITITVKEKDGYTPRLIINGEEVKLSGNQYVYTVTSDQIDVKVAYDENKPTPVSEISSVDNIAVSVFPNPAIKGEKFNINIEGSADLNGAEILIYDSMGRMAKRLHDVSNHNEIDLASGIYNGVFVNKGVRKTFRIVVR